MEPYATNLTDSQWELIEPLLPAPNRRGRPRTLDRRQIVNAIFYLLRCCAPAASGACYPATCLPGAPSTSTIVDGGLMARGSAFTKNYAPWYGTRAGATLAPVQPFWTARASRPRKKGAARLRRGQKRRRPQASHPGRHQRLASGDACPSRQRARSRWCSAFALGLAGHAFLPAPGGDLGGRSLHW